MSRPRAAVRLLVGRLVGERPLPAGRVARTRRLVRRALAEAPAGRVLVVGPGLAVRQALGSSTVDVAAASPHSAEVTVCSTARGAGTLPPGRWDTVVVSDVGQDWTARLAAVLPACRGRLLVLDGGAHALTAGEIEELIARTRVMASIGRFRNHVWVAEVAS